MPINKNYDENAVIQAISVALQEFYDSLLKKIDGF